MPTLFWLRRLLHVTGRWTRFEKSETTLSTLRMWCALAIIMASITWAWLISRGYIHVKEDEYSTMPVGLDVMTASLQRGLPLRLFKFLLLALDLFAGTILWQAQ